MRSHFDSTSLPGGGTPTHSWHEDAGLDDDLPGMSDAEPGPSLADSAARAAARVAALDAAADLITELADAAAWVTCCLRGAAALIVMVEERAADGGRARGTGEIEVRGATASDAAAAAAAATAAAFCLFALCLCEKRMGRAKRRGRGAKGV
mmetsp:Transcript_9247/g.27356  ORF Transcript_9247/g.27356 Transcript_9247/m.27356 type:complete len:151 (-) Transcript_9247:326-778(-)